MISCFESRSPSKAVIRGFNSLGDIGSDFLKCADICIPTIVFNSSVVKYLIKKKKYTLVDIFNTIRDLHSWFRHVYLSNGGGNFNNTKHVYRIQARKGSKRSDGVVDVYHTHLSGEMINNDDILLFYNVEKTLVVFKVVDHAILSKACNKYSNVNDMLEAYYVYCIPYIGSKYRRYIQKN